jgi:acetyltransferase-like isoleucine patch superfamily enzyme
VLSDRTHIGDFGWADWARGVVRRRLGLWWFRKWHRHVTFGPRCDVRAPTKLLVASGATVRFGAGCVLDSGMVVECRGELVVGDRTVFGHHCTVAVSERVEIGRDCLIGELVSIRDHDHGFADASEPMMDQHSPADSVRIGDNVWLGCKVTVVSGVTIGANTIVGANAVVTGNLPPDCIAVGIPARVVRRRS